MVLPQAARRERTLYAFSLIEVLSVVAIIGVIAALALPYAFNAREDAQEVRLQSTVAQLNESLDVYRASGGSVAGLTEPQEVIDKMKTRRDPDAAARFAGFAGSMVDPRLQAVPLKKDQIRSGRLRSVWNADKQRFELTIKPVDGIGDFALVESAGLVDYGTEEREESAISFNTRDGWIWGFEDTSAGQGGSPSQVSLSSTQPEDVTSSSTMGGGGIPGGITQLNPPDFSLLSGYYPLVDFSLSLSLSNPNVNGESQIYYRDGREGTYMPYGGETITVGMDDRVYAFVKSLNPSRYRDSVATGEHYDGDPVQMELDLHAEQTAFSYFDLSDGKGFATARVTNLGKIPESLRNGLRINWGFEGDPAGGQSGSELAGQLIPLAPSSWGGESAATLTAVAEGSGVYVLTSDAESLTLEASVITLESPLIEAVQNERGCFEITLETSGRLPDGNRIFYKTDGEDPEQNEETGEISGTTYEGPFQLVLEEEPFVPSGIPHQKTSGPVAIKKVVLRTNGQTITQNNPASGLSVSNSSSNTVELKGITISQDGEEIQANYLNTLDLTIQNLVYPNTSQSVSIFRGGKNVAQAKNSGFANQLATTLRSADLRDYVDFGTLNTSDPASYLTFDVSFPPIYNTDFLVVSERKGNDAFQLTPLGPDGQPIPGGSTVSFNSYSWNTGYAPSDKKQEPFVLAVADVEDFSVNTDETPITGFRVTSYNGADFKFYTASDITFEDRELPERKKKYKPATVVARVFPPESLANWFDPSAPAMAEIRDETKVVKVDFSLLSSSAGYLNAATLYVNGEAYDFGNSDMGAGFQLSVDIDVNPYASNRFDLVIDTWKRSGDWINGLDTRSGMGFDLIGENDSFAGASDFSAKIKDLSFDSQIHMVVGYEDLICTGGTPDWDYNDFMFEFQADEPFSFLFGGQRWFDDAATKSNGSSDSGRAVDEGNRTVDDEVAADEEEEEVDGGGGSGQGNQMTTVSAPGNLAISNVIFYFEAPGTGRIFRVKWDSVAGEAMTLGFDFSDSAYSGYRVIGYSVKAGANSAGPNGEGEYVSVSGERPSSWSQYIETTFATGVGQGVITVLRTK